MRYLGIDYGKKKVGLAISDGQLASPLKVIEVNGLVDAVQKIERVIEQEGVERVVIGKPESGEARKMVEECVKILEKKIGVEEAEETLSTKQAQNELITMGFSREKRRNEDSQAAAIMLQNYLDRQEPS